MPPINRSPGYIYPVGSSDVLNFRIYPQTMNESFETLGADVGHPGLGHSVSNLTGRASPKFNIDGMFDDLENVNRERSYLGSEANDAYFWLRRHLGPDDSGPMGRRGRVFVMKFWGPPREVIIRKANLRILNVSRSGDVIRRFEATFSGIYYYRTGINPRLFRKGGKKDDLRIQADPLYGRDRLVGPRGYGFPRDWGDVGLPKIFPEEDWNWWEDDGSWDGTVQYGYTAPYQPYVPSLRFSYVKISDEPTE